PKARVEGSAFQGMRATAHQCLVEGVVWLRSRLLPDLPPLLREGLLPPDALRRPLPLPLLPSISSSAISPASASALTPASAMAVSFSLAADSSSSVVL